MQNNAKQHNAKQHNAKQHTIMLLHCVQACVRKYSLLKVQTYNLFVYELVQYEYKYIHC